MPLIYSVVQKNDRLDTSRVYTLWKWKPAISNRNPSIV